MVAASSPGVATLVEKLEPDLIALRRDLHRHPELGFAEERTATIVAKVMLRPGLQLHYRSRQDRHAPTHKGNGPARSF